MLPDVTMTHHLLVDGLGHWVPRLVVLDVAVVGVVGAVADAPAVVGHQDGGVGDVAHQVVDVAVVGEALVAAACAWQPSGFKLVLNHNGWQYIITIPSAEVQSKEQHGVHEEQ